MSVPMTLTVLMMDQLRWLISEGYQVTVVSSPGPQLDGLRRDLPIRVVEVDMFRGVSLVRDAISILRLMCFFIRNRFDLVHAHTPKGGLVGMLAAAGSLHRRRFYTLHGLRYETAIGKRKLLLRSVERLTCRLANRIFCVSESVRSVAIADNLARSNKLQVLCNGSFNGINVNRYRNGRGLVDAEKQRRDLGLPHGAVVAGFVGRLTRDKGIADLIDACRSAREAGLPLHVVVLGEWDESDPVPLDVRGECEAMDWFHLQGNVASPEHWYPIFDFLVLPSYREGFPTVVLESAAAGIPAIGYDTTGIRDAIVHDQTGLLVPLHDRKAFAKAICELGSDQPRRVLYGNNARDRVRSDFLPARIWSELDGAYQSALPVRAEVD
ncbi:MAG: glycosyltransferase family 4 protein [Planctomycetota bacterium]